MSNSIIGCLLLFATVLLNLLRALPRLGLPSSTVVLSMLSGHSAWLKAAICRFRSAGMGLAIQNSECHSIGPYGHPTACLIYSMSRHILGLVSRTHVDDPVWYKLLVLYQIIDIDTSTGVGLGLLLVLIMVYIVSTPQFVPQAKLFFLSLVHSRNNSEGMRHPLSTPKQDKLVEQNLHFCSSSTGGDSSHFPKGALCLLI